jgi:hypothetical protein
MTGGILQLVSYGIQDEILISKPEISMFITVYRNYTNFSIDTLQTKHNIQFNTINNIQIPKTGELLYKVNVKLTIPKIEAYYAYNDDQYIYNIISKPLYNYNNTINNNNIINTDALINAFTSMADLLNYNNLASDFLTFINENNELEKLHYGINGSNFLYSELNENNTMEIGKSNYYLEREILNGLQLSDIRSSIVNLKNLLFTNESNYNKIDEHIFLAGMGNVLVLLFGSFGFTDDIQTNILKLFGVLNAQIYLTKLNYKISLSSDYHSQIRDDLVYLTMPNDYLMQDYSLSINGYNYINDIMPYQDVNGKITCLDNNLTYQPNYLIFVEKTNPTNLIPIYITNINKYTPNKKYTQCDTYFDYSGYIADTDIFYKIISYCLPRIGSYYSCYVQFDFTPLNKAYYSYNQLNLVFPILIGSSSYYSKLNMTYTYKIDIQLPNVYTNGGNVPNLIQTIMACSYLSVLITNNGQIIEGTIRKNEVSQNIYKIPPTAILLLDRTKTPIYDSSTNSLSIYCSYTKKKFDINYLAILSPYVPIVTENNTFFNFGSKNTNFINNYNYSSKKNIDTINNSGTVNGFPVIIFYLLNQLFKDGSLIMKNTIDKKTLNINLDIQHNITQKNNYLDGFHLSDFSDNVLSDLINNNVNTFLNKLSDSYQILSGDTNNYAIFKNLLLLNQTINSYKLNISNKLPFYNSIDMTSIITIIFTSNISNNDIIEFNDFQLTSINKNYEKIYKMRLYANRTTDEPLNQQKTILNDKQISYIKPGNTMTCSKNVDYGTDFYIVEYYYEIISIIDLQTTYIEVYVSPSRKVKNYYRGIYLNDTQISELHFLNQLSYFPNIIDQSYKLSGVTDDTVVYLCCYDLFFFTGVSSQTGTSTNTDPKYILNGQYYLKNYYISKQTSTPLEYFYQITQYQDTYNIYDIISMPNYLQTKILYDTKNIDLNEIDIINLQVFDIYIMMLYESYNNVISNNSNISNTVSLIVQDYSYLISSFFRDPTIYINKYSNYYTSDFSYENVSTNNIENDYESYDKTNYNLFNIFSNSFVLSSKLITNTGNRLIGRLNENLLDIFGNNLTTKQNIIGNIVFPILAANDEQYITQDNFLQFLNNNYSINGVKRVVSNMSKINSLTLGSDTIKYNVFSNKNSTQIQNDILLDTNQIINAINTILTPNKMINETYVDINAIKNSILEVGNIITYSGFIKIINQLMQTYCDIYFKRSDILKPTINSNLFPDSSVNNFIVVFNDSISNFMDITDVTLKLKTTFLSSKMINQTMYDTILSVIINVNNETSVYTLSSDPDNNVPLNSFDNDPDYYKRANSISLFNGNNLIKYVINNILPSCTSVYGIIGGITNGEKELIGDIKLYGSITNETINTTINGSFNGTIDNILINLFNSVVTITNTNITDQTNPSHTIDINIEGSDTNYLLKFTVDTSDSKNSIVVTSNPINGIINVAQTINKPSGNSSYNATFTGLINDIQFNSVSVIIYIISVETNTNKFTSKIRFTNDFDYYDVYIDFPLTKSINYIQMVYKQNSLSQLPVNFPLQYVTINHSILSNYSFDKTHDFITSDIIMQNIYNIDSSLSGKYLIKVLNNYDIDKLISTMAIDNILKKLEELTPIKQTTYNQIINSILIVDFENNSANTLKNKSVKIVYKENDLIFYDTILINDTSDNITSLIANTNNTSVYTNYNFINNIISSFIMTYDSDLAYQLIDLYNKSIEIYISNDIFTQNVMTSIVNLYNSMSIAAITELLNKLSETIDVYYTFINKISNTKLMTSYPNLLLVIKSLYYKSFEFQNRYTVFTTNIIDSLIQLSINNDLIGITPIINKLMAIYTIQVNPIYNTMLNNLNFDYDLHYDYMSTNDKFFYLYNNIIGSMFQNQLISFLPEYSISSQITQQYNIYIQEIDNTFNLTNPKIGPTLKKNFDLGYDKDTNKNYYTTDLNISTTLYNIYSLFNYFSKIVNDPISSDVSNINPFSNPYSLDKVSSIYNEFIESNSNYNIIATLIEYIARYSPSIIKGNVVPQNILLKIDSNPITKIMYDNINIFFDLLIYISSVYSITDLFNGKYSNYNNQIVLLKTDYYYDPIYQVIQTPNILTFQTDSYDSCLNNNNLINCISGALDYNIDNSIYVTFKIFIDNQKNAYDKLVSDSFEQNIGKETDIYTNIHLSFNKIDIQEELNRINFIQSNLLSSFLYFSDTNSFKSGLTIMQFTTNTNLYTLFFQISQYLRTNYTSYVTSLNDLDFLQHNINTSIYSNTEKYYGWINSLSDITQNIISIAKNNYYKYLKSDMNTINNIFISLSKTNILTNNMFGQMLKESLLHLNVDQLIDLHNFNTYYTNFVINNVSESDSINNYNTLITTLNYVNDKSYEGKNAGSNFIIFIPQIKITNFIINDYVNDFYTSNLSNVLNKNRMLLIMQNTKVSEKIIDAINCFEQLSIYEKNNVIKIYNDMPKLNLLIAYLNSIGDYSLNGLKNYPITSVINGITYTKYYCFYDIIMTTIEYNLIFGSVLKYNFMDDSIGILIYDKTTFTKYDINLIYNITNLDTSSTAPYEFILYRKTDLPREYKYIFNTINKTIKQITIKNKVNEAFNIIYNQTSIYNDTNIISEKTNKASLIYCYTNTPTAIVNLLPIISNYGINENVDTINLVDYYTFTKIDQYGKFSFSYISNYFGSFILSSSGTPTNYVFKSINGINLCKIFRSLVNPVKLFNAINYISYYQPNALLSYESNYSANIIILLYAQNNQSTQKLIQYMYSIDQYKTINILSYIGKLNGGIYNYLCQYFTSLGINVNIAIFANDAYFIYITLNNLSTTTNDLIAQTFFINTLYSTNDGTSFNYNIYASYFIIELYNYNVALMIYLNPALIIMDNLYKTTSTKNTYNNIIGYIKTIDPNIGSIIETYVSQQNSGYINVPNKTLPQITNENVVILNDDDANKIYNNTINSDEQYMSFYDPNSFVVVSDVSSGITNIKFKNTLLNKNQKLLKITQTSNTDPTNIKTNFYGIDDVKNYTNKININFPYNLFFIDSLDNMKKIFDLRIQKNIICNNYIGNFILYITSSTTTLAYSYPKKYIDYQSDFFINIITINGIQYKLNDLQFNPISTLANSNIPPLYSISNITQISFNNSNSGYIEINKNYLQSNSILVQLNNMDKLYISTNYYIFSGQDYQSPKIVSIGDKYSIVTLKTLINPSMTINKINFGIKGIFDNINFLNNANVQILGTKYTLYDAFEFFDTNNLINQTITFDLNLNVLENNMSKYDEVFYKNLNGVYNINTITTQTSLDTLKNIISNYGNLNTNYFKQLYDIQPTNNYKIKYYNIADVINFNNTFIYTIGSEIKVLLNNLKNIELSLKNSRNLLYIEIIDFLNKPDIPSFSYIPFLADFIFENVAFKIDGNVIDELEGKYLFVYHNFINNKSKQLGYNKQNQNNATLLLNSKIKDETSLYVELPLYFTQIPGVAFPLISTIYSKLELSMKIKNIEDITVKNKFVSLKFKNRINMEMIYSVIYLDDHERELFSTQRHEYLIEKKIYCTQIQIDQSKLIQNKFRIPFTFPIKDYFYFLQLDDMVKAGQNYNFTSSYLLPNLYDLNMTTREKIIYLQQQIDLKYYDDDIYNLYIQLIQQMIKKITLCNLKITKNNSNRAVLSNKINFTSLRYLYNNLTIFDEMFVENLFTQYYEKKIHQDTITKTKLFLNGVVRSSEDSDFTSKIMPFQYYNNMLCCLHAFSYSLHPNEYQPAGYSNFYMFNPECQITIDQSMQNIPSYKIIKLHLFARSYNIIRHMGGIAGMAW